MVHQRLVYIHLLNVPSFSSRYFNKNKTNVSFREIARLIARNSYTVPIVYQKNLSPICFCGKLIYFQRILEKSQTFLCIVSNYNIPSIYQDNLRPILLTSTLWEITIFPAYIRMKCITPGSSCSTLVSAVIFCGLR